MLHKALGLWVGFILLMTAIFFITSCDSPDTASSSSSSPPPPNIPYPEAGQILTNDDVNNLIFYWDEFEEIKEEHKILLRLYQVNFDSSSYYSPIPTSISNLSLYFDLIYTEEILSNQFSSTKAGQEVGPGHMYAWEVVQHVVGVPEVAIKKLETFITGRVGSIAQPTGNTEAILELSQKIDSLHIHKPFDCESIIFSIPPDLTLNTHIATFKSIKYFQENLLTRMGDEVAREDTCYQRESGNIKIASGYKVYVPCDSLDMLPPFVINADIFRDDIIMPPRFLTSKKFYVNGEIESKYLNLQITKNDFLPFCEGDNNESLSCLVEIGIVFDFFAGLESSRAPLPDFNLVFNINEEIDHTHYSNSQLATENNGNDIDNQSSNHSHSSLVSDCPNDPSLLSYYLCRDTSNNHIAEHIVVVPLTVCSN